MMEQVAGTVQNAYGQAVDAAAEGADAVKQAAIESHDFLKRFIEEIPIPRRLSRLASGFSLDTPLINHHGRALGGIDCRIRGSS
jgi:hypothetical protein